MLFLVIEFTFVAILGRLLQFLLDTSVLFDLSQPPPGHLYIPLYLWVSFRIFNHYIRGETKANRFRYTSAFCYKLVFACIMTYLSVNVYGGGDMTGYYTLPYWVADRLVTFDWDNIKHIAILSGYYFREAGLNSTTLISYVFSAVFVIFPPSLFGLTLLSGTVIFIATLAVYKLLEPYIQYRKIFFWMYFFAPSMTLQLGYTGKETVIVPLVAGVIVLTAKSSSLWVRALLLSGIFYIRFYQAFFLILAWIGSRFTMRQLFSIRGIPFVFAGVVACIFIYRKAMDKIGELGFSSLGNLAEFMSMVYAKGNLVLPPLPFPFTYLQAFRPFPWEAHNTMALVVSLEMLVFFGLTVYLLAIRSKPLRQRFKLDPTFRFLTLYVVIQIAIFSYNDNMGDLARRKIYFLPLLIGLLCYRKMSPEEVLAARLGGLRVKLPPPPPLRSSVPSPAAAPPDSASPSPAT